MLKRLLALPVVVLAVLLGTAVAADAHVRVTSTDATRGGYGVLTFRVPTESATASTTKLQVTFPKDHPIASVSTQPVPGWAAKVDTAKLATPIKTDDGELTDYVTQVTWTADSAGTAIKPSEFEQFDVSAGPLPDVASLSFPTVQTYSDGSTVDWNQQSADGSEPEHPAPTLALAAPSDESASTTATTTPHAATTPADHASSPASWPGWVGLVLGVVAVVLGAAALVRSGRRPTSG